MTAVPTWNVRDRASRTRRGIYNRMRRIAPAAVPLDRSVASLLEADLARNLEACRPFTLTSVERLAAVSDAVDYVVRARIPGALTECGVWRGGSVMAMLLALQRRRVDDRDIWLYDTFDGMTEPGEHDISPVDPPGVETWAKANARGRKPWPEFFEGKSTSLEQVRSLLLSTGYPEERLHFIVGPVETTLPAARPERIAVLRLDTDWYESTRHEMLHLYPRLTPGGVLIIDDYGHWEGSRKAVDEYLDEHGDALLLHRTDYTGRMAIKPSQ